KADDNDPLHALTATNLDVKANCKNNKFNFIVRSVFVVNESWSKNKKSEKLLLHEQLHFDLTEVYARKLRKKLSEIEDPCLLSNQESLNPIIAGIFDEWKAEQDRYDADCDHGLDYEKQDEWVKNINARLKELEAYKS
ncbi:MAG: DUF922 domain-containing Zn-dependent protease, partial [Hymenobacteraceae bacterium]|nr:DUF922 domain-containing Zn-dependent protease [Hymenobacteraceae bacterium]MDX5396823.1 DUF922 domain-containing Zn-dependent protease [Hymenobacteraceae bacterium]MDX5512894.1 DUF922 domain-containing Zn-dependent protease [Hymenobacteraceae bacterium]